MKLSVLIPVYNEEQNIDLTLSTLRQALEGIADFEIIVIDDGSKDGTLERIMKHNYVNVISHSRNRGLGAAVRTGIAACAGDVIITYDSDLSYDVSHIPRLIRAIDACDAVTCSPYGRGGRVIGINILRLLLSKAISVAYSLITGVNLSCFTSMCRAYQSIALRTINIEFDGFESQAEILCKLALKGYTIREIPAGLRVRLRGYSKFKTLGVMIRHLRLLVFLVKLRILGVD